MAASVRAVAAALLQKCADAEQYSNIALDTAISRNSFSDADRALLTALVYGVIERQITLDYIISVLAKRPAEDISHQVRTLLRLGLYQLAYLDRIPMHAAVNETVDLAPKQAKGFVNAVLRAWCRTSGGVELPQMQDDPIRALSVRFSFDERICERFVNTFGVERTESLFGAFCKKPPLTLRVNTLRTDRESLLAALIEQGFDAALAPRSKTAIHVKGNAPVRTLPGFDQGWFFVQDEASQLCVEAVDAHAGMRVIDVCACPGSKSFGIAIDMENAGEVISCDLHANKLSLVESGAARLGISTVTTAARDARVQNEAWLGTADRVLCDVPCSGFGVFAKKPELRYKDPAKSDALPQIQRDILHTASAYVKSGGMLIYSTCTLLPQENEQNVKQFLDTHANFVCKSMRTLTPDADGTDGFFYAVLERVC